MTESDRFLEEAERRGLLDASRAADCRRIAQALDEVGVELSIDEIAARKGFVTPAQGAEIRRALSRLRVGRYEVVERLGQGAAGVVWKARDVKLDRIVALKVLSQKDGVSSSFRERFAREARIAVTLNHVNIVRGLDYGEADGYQYFAMEFVDGENAETRLARLGRIPEKEAVAMALDVVHALEYVQRFHIVHRDIKPSNMLLTPSGHVKLCDLGLAKPMLTESELLAGDGSTAGTPLYMSPEQIREPDKIDWRSDIYSLGATLYHLLTGVPPFAPDTRAGILQKHLKEKPRNPRDHALDVSDGAASVVMRMLQKAPSDRYGALGELAGDLEAVLEGRQPSHTLPAPAPVVVTAERHARMAVARRITERNLPRERFPVFYVAAFAMLLVTVVVIGIKLNTPPPAPPVPADGSPPPVVKDPANPAPGDAGGPPVVIVPPVDPVLPTGEELARAQKRRAELQRLRDAAPALFQEGQYDLAIKPLRDFAASNVGTHEGDVARQEAANLEAKTRSRFQEVIRNANEDALRHRFDAARAKVADAAGMRVHWAEAEAKNAAAEVEALAQRYEADRERQADAFASLYGRAVLEAGENGVDEAKALVDREEKSVPAYDDDVAALREDLATLARHGTDPSRFDGRSLYDAPRLLLAQLAHGDVTGAERTVQAIDLNGGDAAEARARVRHVRRVVSERLAKTLAEADEARAAKRFDDALRLANSILDRLEDYVPARILIGRIRYDQGQLLMAQRALEPLARGADAPAEARYWLGKVLAALGEDPERAEFELAAYLEDAPDGDPYRPDARRTLDEVHARRVEASVKQWRTIARAARPRADRQAVAEGAWSRIVELIPDDAEALLALGQIYVDSRESLPAFVVYSRVAGLPAGAATDAQRKTANDRLAQLRGKGYSSEDGRAFAARGERKFANESWADAIREFHAALLLSPYLVTTRTHLVQALLALDLETKSAEAAREAAEVAGEMSSMFPDDALYPALRAEANLRLADTKTAVKDAERAVQIDARSSAAQLALGRALLAVGEVTRALSAFQASYERAASADALLGLARCHLKKGDVAPARDVLDTCRVKFGPPPRLKAEFDELMKLTTERQ